jgi:hypothetical protein
VAELSAPPAKIVVGGERQQQELMKEKYHFLKQQPRAGANFNLVT